MSVRKEFSLSETLSGALGAICGRYGLDRSWLAWQYERHVLINGASPFRVTTSEYTHAFNEGIEKIKVEIEFQHEQPNQVKWIRFEEFPTDKTYIVTQTSLNHVNEDSPCVLWLELPKGARGTAFDIDIAAARSLQKVDLCCPEWKDSLPKEPVTALERAQFYAAQDDLNWVKNQLLLKDQSLVRVTDALDRLNRLLSCKKLEATSLSEALQKESDKLRAEIARTTKLGEENAELKATVEKMRAQFVSDLLDAKMRNAETTAQKVQDAVDSTKSEIAKMSAAIAEVQTKLAAINMVSGQPAADSSAGSPSKKRKRILVVRTPKTPKSKAKSMSKARTEPIEHRRPLPSGSQPYTNKSFTALNGSPLPRSTGGRYNMRGGGVASPMTLDGPSGTEGGVASVNGGGQASESGVSSGIGGDDAAWRIELSSGSEFDGAGVTTDDCFTEG